MLKLTLRSFFDRKIRLALTTFAVVLGVAFVSGSFVLADSLRAVFDDIAEEVGAPISVRVRGISAIESNDLTRPPSPDSLVDELAGVDGVASVSGIVEGFPFVSTADGELVRSQGPTLAYNYEADAVSAIEIVRGDAPGTGEVLFDEFAADRYDIAIGDVVNVRTLAEPEDFTVSGIASFGEEDFGAVFVLFDTPTAQRLFGLPDSFSYINVSAAGALSPDELAERVNATLPADFEAVTGEVVSDEFSAFFDVIITVFQSALLAFAAVALVVSAFIINNTFSIVLGQRIKELGLLRCLGASGRQVRTSVLVEALLIGGVASVAGLFGGLGVAALINQIISAAGDGGGLPSGGIILAPRTWIVAIVVGVGVTLLASLSPARRAASIPPIAALSDDFVLSATRTRRRVLVGLAFAVCGRTGSDPGSARCRRHHDTPARAGSWGALAVHCGGAAQPAGCRADRSCGGCAHRLDRPHLGNAGAQQRCAQPASHLGHCCRTHGGPGAGHHGAGGGDQLQEDGDLAAGDLDHR